MEGSVTQQAATWLTAAAIEAAGAPCDSAGELATTPIDRDPHGAEARTVPLLECPCLEVAAVTGVRSRPAIASQRAAHRQHARDRRSALSVGLSFAALAVMTVALVVGW